VRSPAAAPTEYRASLVSLSLQRRERGQGNEGLPPTTLLVAGRLDTYLPSTPFTPCDFVLCGPFQLFYGQLFP
jgi:hypothetical protein